MPCKNALRVLKIPSHVQCGMEIMKYTNVESFWENLQGKTSLAYI